MQIAFLFNLCAYVPFAQASDSHVLIDSSQHSKGFSGMMAREDGKLLILCHPKNVRLFNPMTRKFEQDIFTLPSYSFSDEIANIPRDDTRGIPGGYALACALDGKVVTVLLDGTVIESNVEELEPVLATGDYNAQVNPASFGLSAIAYRRSNDRLYCASSLVGNALFKVDWRGAGLEGEPSTTLVPLNAPVELTLNAFQFGPDDKLYAPNVEVGQIVRINADTGDVETLLSNVPSPIALKISSQSIVYFITKNTAEVFKYNIATATKTKLATLEPPLDNLTLNLDETKLYVSSKSNQIFEVDVESGSKKTLFSSQLIRPNDLAYDIEADSLYIADCGVLREVRASNGKLIRSLTFESYEHPELNNIGAACGIDVERGPQAKIVISDSIHGKTVVLNKKDLSVDTVLCAFPDRINFPGQPFSAVRINQGNRDFFLVTDTVQGNIMRLNRDGSGSVFFSGLKTPVKLKIANGYLYIVEAGDLVHLSDSSGRVSRIPLNEPFPENLEILLDHLNNPQGLDLFEDRMVLLEAGKKWLIEASSISESQPLVLKKNLNLSSDILISPVNPIPIDSFAGVAIDSNGKKVFLNQTAPNNILEVKRAEILKKIKPKNE